jgi:hypothetical protein
MKNQVMTEKNYENKAKVDELASPHNAKLFSSATVLRTLCLETAEMVV